jgi:hypothetical protein
LSRSIPRGLRSIQTTPKGKQGVFYSRCTPYVYTIPKANPSQSTPARLQRSITYSSPYWYSLDICTFQEEHGKYHYTRRTQSSSHPHVITHKTDYTQTILPQPPRSSYIAPRISAPYREPAHHAISIRSPKSYLSVGRSAAHHSPKLAITIAGSSKTAQRAPK